MRLSWKKSNRIKIAITLLIAIVVTNSIRAEANVVGDSEDLLNIYGMTLGSMPMEVTEKNMEAYELQRRAIEEKIEIDRNNSFVKSINSKNENYVSDINNQINYLMNENTRIIESISSSIVDAPIKELLIKDETFKANITTANTLLNNLDFYKTEYTKSEYSYDLDEIEKDLEIKKIIHVKTGDVYPLGDISNIKWIMPNKYHVTSKYGTRIDPIKKNITSFHAGTDFRAPVGTPIGSLFNGVVSSCGWSNSIGYFVIVASGPNVKTMVCHLSSLKVEKGDTVNQYDVVGLSGGTGARSTAPHLHLALYLNGSTYDVTRLFAELENEK